MASVQTTFDAKTVFQLSNGCRRLSASEKATVFGDPAFDWLKKYDVYATTRNGRVTAAYRSTAQAELKTVPVMQLYQSTHVRAAAVRLLQERGWVCHGSTLLDKRIDADSAPDGGFFDIGVLTGAFLFELPRLQMFALLFDPLAIVWSLGVGLPWQELAGMYVLNRKSVFTANEVHELDRHMFNRGMRRVNVSSEGVQFGEIDHYMRNLYETSMTPQMLLSGAYMDLSHGIFAYLSGFFMHYYQSQMTGEALLRSWKNTTLRGKGAQFMSKLRTHHLLQSSASQYSTDQAALLQTLLTADAHAADFARKLLACAYGRKALYSDMHNYDMSSVLEQSLRPDVYATDCLAFMRGLSVNHKNTFEDNVALYQSLLRANATRTDSLRYDMYVQPSDYDSQLLKSEESIKREREAHELLIAVMQDADETVKDRLRVSNDPKSVAIQVTGDGDQDDTKKIQNTVDSYVQVIRETTHAVMSTKDDAFLSRLFQVDVLALLQFYATTRTFELFCAATDVAPERVAEEAFQQENDVEHALKLLKVEQYVLDVAEKVTGNDSIGDAQRRWADWLMGFEKMYATYHSKASIAFTFDDVLKALDDAKPTTDVTDEDSMN
jgi:hypothetical protein